MPCVLMLSCVNIKTHLTDEDLSWLPYKPGDTLTYVSSKGNYDTLIIVERKTYYSTYMPNGAPTKYKSEIGEILYSHGSKLEAVSINLVLVKIIKSTPKVLSKYFTLYDIQFNFDEYYEDSLIQLNVPLLINGNSYTDVIKMQKNNNFKLPDFKSPEFIPRTLFWSKQKGLIKYITYSDETWELIE